MKLTLNKSAEIRHRSNPVSATSAKQLELKAPNSITDSSFTFIETNKTATSNRICLLLGNFLPQSSFVFVLAIYLALNTVSAAADKLPFLQNNQGLVTIEAEHHHVKTAKRKLKWVFKKKKGYSGEGAMMASANKKTAIKSKYKRKSPRMDYQVKFNTPGTYHVWFRALGPRRSSNSVHIGLNGKPIKSGKNITVPVTSDYTWTNGRKTLINIPTPGVHTFNVWMRESGTVLDKLVLSNDPGFTPSGKGPNESLTDDQDDEPPIFSPESPNIVLILADDMGYSDLGSYGGEIETPNLDRLAANGLRFTNFYNAAKCEQSRATLLSGLYHHQTAEKHGNNTRLMAAKNHVTIAEALQRGGYRTMISGKWHVHGNPLNRGFDRYFGFYGGTPVDYFTGEDYLKSGNNAMKLDHDTFEIPENGYYLTDAITNYAIEFVDEAVTLEKPFFLFVNHFAPHFPLQAPTKDIEKYRGKYLAGWDRLRKQRLKRMRELGVVDPSWSLSPRDRKVPRWNSFSPSEQREQDLLMAVYAAMIDRMDQNIGRLMAHLDERGLTHNTLVIFLSDNGGNDLPWDRTPNLEPGPARHYRGIKYWYNLSNTPFRRHKRKANEGGIATPAIAYWPAVINRYGDITDTVAHFVDLMPTLLDVAGVDYPERYDGHDVLPMEGVSFMPVLVGKERARTEEPLFWEHKGSRAVRIGSYKLVATARKSPWALYDMQADRVELINLIEADSKRATKMRRLFKRWAKRVGVP